MELLNPHINQIIYSVVAFFVLLVILSKIAFPPITGMLQKRSDAIKDSLDAADRAREEAATLLEDYKKQVAEAREESQKIIEDGRKFGESMKDEIVQKARREAAQVMAKATEDLTREKESALSELRSKVADLTIEAASKVVGQTLDKQSHQQLIEQYLTEAGKISEN